MSEPSSDDWYGVQWCSRHWWSRDYTLIAGAKTIASARFRGSRGTAVVAGRSYDLRRFRRRPISFITIRDSANDELVACMRVVPMRGGFPAEFADGERFQWGRVKWWQSQWAWTNEAGETILSSRRSLFPHRYYLHVELAADKKTWPMLALLELAMRELSPPWF